jgi:outer membrane PBP1 activator LpoA protein
MTPGVRRTGLRHGARHTAASRWPATVLLLVLAGCAAAPPPVEPPSPERAAAFAARGDHAAAARDYETLAGFAPIDIASDFKLLAARQWLSAGEPAKAQTVLASLGGALDARQASDRDLSAAEAAFALGEAARGWSILEKSAPPAANAGFDRYHALRQRLAFATDRPLEGIQSNRARDARASDPAQRSALRQELLEQLRRAAAAGATLDPRAAGRDAVARGWLEAAPVAARAATAPAASNAALTAAWRKRYPDHPAGGALSATYLGSAALAGSRPASTGQSDPAASEPAGPPVPAALAPGAHVAALLPLSGRNAAVGAQLRDGLLAAFHAQPAEGRPTLRFYDIATRSVDEAVADARAAGASFLIGPLMREDVAAAAAAMAASPGGPPLLALNFLPPPTPSTVDAPPAGLYQFGLSPEAEARDTARRALADGRRRGVALVPEGDWGQRVLASFREEFEAGGGTLLGSQVLRGRDLGPAVRSALGIDASRGRHQRLQSLLGTSLVFQPRRRGDVDLLFAPGQPGIVRQLRSQLQFEAAADIPMYSISDAWDGRVDADLNGLVFTDMPWMIAPRSGRSATLRSEVEAAWGDLRGRGRLFALGHDAWIVQEGLRTGRFAAGRGELEGVTGQLALDDARRVQRGLRWAEVRNGTLRLLDDAP